MKEFLKQLISYEKYVDNLEKILNADFIHTPLDLFSRSYLIMLMKIMNIKDEESANFLEDLSNMYNFDLFKNDEDYENFINKYYNKEEK